MNIFDLFINVVESFTICYFFGKYFELKNYKQYILNNIVIFLEITAGNLFINTSWLLIIIVGLTLLLLLKICHVRITIESAVVCICILFMDMICNNVALLIVSFFNMLISLENMSLTIVVILSKIFFIFVAVYISNKKIKFNTQLDENRWGSIVIVFSLLLISFYILANDYVTNNLNKVDVFICMILISINAIMVINVYLSILEENEEKMKIKIKNEEIKYKKENYIILARMSDELYRLQHNLRYVLLKIKYCLNDREYDKCKNLVDSYVDKLRKFKILINTDNPYFDYLINQELNDLDLRGIDINISVSISNSDYYLNKNYVNYVISLMEYLKDKVKKLTINIYEVNNNNVIEIILNELDDFFIQKNIQDLILLIDAEYKISKQNEMLIFKSIQQIHN